MKEVLIKHKPGMLMIVLHAQPLELETHCLELERAGDGAQMSVL